MADGGLAPARSHAWHDPVAVAASVDRGRGADDLPALARGCPGCDRLRDDLLTIAGLLPHVLTPRLERDCTLTPTEAARLGRRDLRRLLRGIGGARDAATRPLAVGFTTLGLAGLLVATAPADLIPVGGADAAWTDLPEQMTDPEVRGAAASAAPAGSQPLPDDAGAVPARPMGAVDVPRGPSALHGLSGSFLAAGLALFGIRRLAGGRWGR